MNKTKRKQLVRKGRKVGNPEGTSSNTSTLFQRHKLKGLFKALAAEKARERVL